MKIKGSRLLATVLSIVGAPIAFGLFVHVSYRVALARDELPFGEVGFWPVFWLVALAGLASLAHGLARLPNWWLVACALYAVLMPIGLFVVGLLVGCANGDCL